MKSSILMDFSVDKVNKEINISREFAAPIEKVWAAWTESDLLDQWWAPKPWKARTKSMDFKAGGHWLYAMVGPDGEEHWGRVDYEKIQPKKNFTALDGFSDSEGKLLPDFPQNHWDTHFKEKSNSTQVDIKLTFNSLSDLEKIIEMGFKEGFIAALENLDELLKA